MVYRQNSGTDSRIPFWWRRPNTLLLQNSGTLLNSKLNLGNSISDCFTFYHLDNYKRTEKIDRHIFRFNYNSVSWTFHSRPNRNLSTNVKIENEIHAEPKDGKFETFEQALEILKERVKIPFDQKPNICPCTYWKNCERQCQIIEYDGRNIPWKELGRQEVLTISTKGIKWNEKIITPYNIV